MSSSISFCALHREEIHFVVVVDAADDVDDDFRLIGITFSFVHLLQIGREP